MEIPSPARYRPPAYDPANASSSVALQDTSTASAMAAMAAASSSWPSTKAISCLSSALSPPSERHSHSASIAPSPSHARSGRPGYNESAIEDQLSKGARVQQVFAPRGSVVLFDYDVPLPDTTRAPPDAVLRISTSSTSVIVGTAFVNSSNDADERHT